MPSRLVTTHLEADLEVAARRASAGILSSSLIEWRDIGWVSEETQRVRPRRCQRAGAVSLPLCEVLRASTSIRLVEIERQRGRVVEDPRVGEERVILEVLADVGVINNSLDTE
jgi:hypothetical protein